MTREQILRRRIKVLTWFFILGLILSGATAIPLPSEVDWLVKVTGANQFIETPASRTPPSWAVWLLKVQGALRDNAATHPFLFYGTDWLAFGHFAIAIAFIGALRDPVRNSWLVQFGMIACVLALRYAFVFGAVGGLQIYWRLVICSFAVVRLLLLRHCILWTQDRDRL